MDVDVTVHFNFNWMTCGSRYIIVSLLDHWGLDCWIVRPISDSFSTTLGSATAPTFMSHGALWAPDPTSRLLKCHGFWTPPYIRSALRACEHSALLQQHRVAHTNGHPALTKPMIRGSDCAYLLRAISISIGIAKT
jgi:hypothetical protein